MPAATAPVVSAFKPHIVSLSIGTVHSARVMSVVPGGFPVLLESLGLIAYLPKDLAYLPSSSVNYGLDKDIVVGQRFPVAIGIMRPDDRGRLSIVANRRLAQYLSNEDAPKELKDGDELMAQVVSRHPDRLYVSLHESVDGEIRLADLKRADKYDSRNDSSWSEYAYGDWLTVKVLRAPPHGMARPDVGVASRGIILREIGDRVVTPMHP